MTKHDKLLQKLRQGSIDAKELITLLKQEGWTLDRTKGSHEVWIKGPQTYVLATHTKDLKPYQRRAAQELLLKEDHDEEEKD